VADDAVDCAGDLKSNRARSKIRAASRVRSGTGRPIECSEQRDSAERRRFESVIADVKPFNVTRLRIEACFDPVARGG
jgi:hypothetical protein